MVRNYRKYTDADIVCAVRNSFNITQVIRQLGLRPAGGTHKTIKNKTEKLKLDISHFKKSSYIGNFGHKRPLSYYLKKDTIIRSTYLKKRLIEENILKNQCQICEQLPIWNNKPLVLELDHIDGDIYNNEISNVRILCGHCHSQTPTFRQKKMEIRYCSSCDNKITKTSKTGLCSSCFNKTRDYLNVKRKITNRPPKEQLLKEVEKLGYCAVGRKYEISDNTVRKWVK